MDSNSPIFISGYQRSGTTLLGNLIDRHSNVAVFLESFFIPYYFYAEYLFRPLSNPDNLRALARSIVAQESSQINGLSFTDEQIFSVKSLNCSELIRVLLDDWATEQGKKRWADKSPGYITKYKILRWMFPDAKFIHIVRDGRDVWLSIRKLGWENNLVKVADSWAVTVGAASQFGRDVLGDSYLETRYEDLTENPNQELSRIMKFIGEDFEQGQLDNVVWHSRNVGFRNWPNINDKVDAKNTEKWRSQLNDSEVELFDYVGSKTLMAFGYESRQQFSTKCKVNGSIRKVHGRADSFLGKLRRGTKGLLREARYRFK